MKYLALAALLVVGVAHAADYTRDGGTGDWQCCQDKACTSIISQHADPVRAAKACEKLTDADGKTRYTRSNAFRITVTPGPTPVSATLSWVPPTRFTDGTVLTDLARLPHPLRHKRLSAHSGDSSCKPCCE